MQLRLGEELPEAMTAAEPAAVTVKLLDLDPVLKELTVSFPEGQFSAEEGGQDASGEVRLSEAADRTVTIALDVTPRGGATNADYAVAPLEIAFSVGMQLASIKVTAVADSFADSGENVDLAFGELPEGVDPGPDPMVAVSLIDRRSVQQVERSLEVLLAVIARSVAQSAQTAIENRFERKCLPAQPPGSVPPPAAGSTLTHLVPSRDPERAYLGPARAGGGLLRAAAVDREDAMLTPIRLVSSEAQAASAWREPASAPGPAPFPGVAGFASPGAPGSAWSQATLASGPFQEVGPSLASNRYGGSSMSLAAAAFNLELQDDQDGAGRCATIWGQGDMQGFNGSLDRLALNYSGTLAAGHAGVDFHVSDRLLVGLAFMRSDAAADYGVDGISGTLQHAMNSFHPYAYLEPDERLGLWFIGGFGQGAGDLREPGRGIR